MKTFLKHLNSFTTNLSFTHEVSKNCIQFLDLKVKLIDGTLETDLYMKPTDHHQYLRSIVYSQNLRVNRPCSLEKDLTSTN